MRRGGVLQAINDSIGIAAVVASRIGKGGSVELQIKASDDDDAAKGGEWCEWWGGPGLATLPLPGAEALFVDLNGERLVIGVKERRWQQKLTQGETVVRALGSQLAAKITLSPDGGIVAGDDTATFVVLLPLLKAWMTALNEAVIAASTTSPPTTGVEAVALITGTTTIALEAFLVGASKLRAT